MKIAAVVGDVHMGLGHEGLERVCTKVAKIDPAKMKEGELVFFINRARDKIKILGRKQDTGWQLVYLKTPGGQKLMMEAIHYIPQTYGAGKFNYDEACKKALTQSLLERGRKGKLSPSVLY